MNGIDFIVILVIAAVLTLAVWNLRRNKKKGASCPGCGGCSAASACSVNTKSSQDCL